MVQSYEECIVIGVQEIAKRLNEDSKLVDVWIKFPLDMEWIVIDVQSDKWRLIGLGRVKPDENKVLEV
jgi:hypothetical protein